ncbi:MAG: Protease PrsW [Candidatus Wolfebacteria bacterium GW2011_GWE2_44_13]|uniref:Protease PrsW n=1 Tax=Candidatus Wolfebacteria bacterium GW2011_GWE2_44_13 TaxID=1619017 RepID=A0A0G1JHN1_9BACT|nr:MAG: Protease PrsW [Candidatus Wolfebacteria bacterium GW2011_GWE2_44_13]
MNFLVLLLGLIPSFIWLSFFLQEDIHPEPRKMIFAVFITGALAALGAYFIQLWLSGYFPAGSEFTHSLLYIAAFAGVEEFVKFLATYTVIWRSAYFDEPIDAMVYMMTAAMGLAAVENIAIAFDTGIAAITVGSLMFRFLGATLLHALSSLVMGYYWGRGIIKKHTAIYLMWGFIMATLLHTIFNYLIVVFDAGILYAIGVLILAAFFVFYDFEKLKKNDTITV